MPLIVCQFVVRSVWIYTDVSRMIFDFIITVKPVLFVRRRYGYFPHMYLTSLNLRGRGGSLRKSILFFMVTGVLRHTIHIYSLRACYAHRKPGNIETVHNAVDMVRVGVHRHAGMKS